LTCGTKSPLKLDANKEGRFCVCAILTCQTAVCPHAHAKQAGWHTMLVAEIS
jgi:hypothetical protein